jgi:radical SAM protein with 4Fe4S-binding SPASM domain
MARKYLSPEALALAMEINLKQLLSTKKFIPIYASRDISDTSVLGPVAVELHWTATCNYSCIHCSYTSRRQSRQTLTSSVIQATVDDLIELKTRAVYLTGGGEPTTLQGWDQYARLLMDGNVEAALITNGIALQQSQLDVVRRLNYIAVSIYSTDPEEYHLITGGRFFDKQFALPALIKGQNNRAVVGARCILNRINYKRVVSIYQHAMRSLFDYVIFIPAVDYEGKGVDLRAEELAEVKEILTEQYTLFDLKNTNIDDLLRREIHHYEVVDYRTSFAEPPSGCTAIRIRGNAFINYDGGVYLCQPHIGNTRFCIGNVNETRFRDMWNSKQHLEVITRLNKEFAQGSCKNCRSINFNKAADAFRHAPFALNDIADDPFI